MKKLALVLAVILALATAATAFAVDVTLQAQNDSGQDGMVRLEAMGNQTKVTIDIKPGPAGVAQPAHIHEGTCANLNPRPAFPLQSVVDGKSETILDVPLSTIQATQHSVNVHKSAGEASIYVSCGEIATAAAAQALPRTGGPALGLVVLAGAALVGTGYALHRRSRAA